VIDALLAAVRRMAEMPEIGHPREDLADEPLRLRSVWCCLVVHRVTERIEIVRVLHASRDATRELRESP
jgi:antitoxin ParD1/3/4/toxin ParE1/3/4